MPSRIVTSTYRYKRPPQKRKAVPLQGPAAVTKRRALPSVGKRKPEPDASPPASDGRKSAIVTAKRRPGRFGDVPDMTREEHRRRGDAADALFREMARRVTGKD